MNKTYLQFDLRHPIQTLPRRSPPPPPVSIAIPMSPLLFVAPCLLRTLRNPSRICVRRPRTLACAAPEEQDREIGEPAWMNLAREISPKDSDDAPRPPPKWEYPEGDPSIPEGDHQNPWNTWNAAIENDAPVEERDIKAETDFWRSAAKELTEESHHAATAQPVHPISAPPDDILTDEPSKSEHVWRMARGVTGEMTELQDKLRSELERYNPAEKVDHYRDIARELVGPTEEPWENSDPRPTSQTDAEAGSGWNPDVDWMRFDDVRREQAKEAEKAARMDAERVAREQMDEHRNDAQDDFVDVDEDPQTGFAGVDEELTRTFTDQSVDETFIRETPMEKLPGFLTNRLRRSGTYGGAWSGAEEEARKLQEDGVQLRDPQADTNRWRGVARELNTEVAADGEEAIPEEDELERTSAEAEAEVEAQVDDVTEELEQVTLAAEKPEEVKASGQVDEESPWSSWRSGAANWEAANENVKARDPEKEVDMWRSSARELISTTPVSEESTPIAQSETKGEANAPEDEGSAWDKWRSANAQWEKSISAASGEPKPMSENKWGNSDQSDWGAGLGTKTMSERSAWEQWNSVSGMDANSGSSLWWNTRTDSSFESDSSKPDRSVNNADEWRSIARETLNLPEKKVDIAPTSKVERIEKDTSLNSWRSIAKDLIEDHDD